MFPLPWSRRHTSTGPDPAVGASLGTRARPDMLFAIMGRTSSAEAQVHDVIRGRDCGGRSVGRQAFRTESVARRGAHWIAHRGGRHGGRWGRDARDRQTTSALATIALATIDRAIIGQADPGPRVSPNRTITPANPTIRPATSRVQADPRIRPTATLMRSPGRTGSQNRRQRPKPGGVSGRPSGSGRLRSAGDRERRRPPVRRERRMEARRLSPAATRSCRTRSW